MKNSEDHFLDDFTEKYDSISSQCKTCKELETKKARISNEAKNREKSLVMIKDTKTKENTLREIKLRKDRINEIDAIIDRHCHEK